MSLDPLFDEHPGGAGFLASADVVARILFQEPRIELAPVDAENALSSFVRTQSTPDVLPNGFTGPAREFQEIHGFQAIDTGGVTYLPQSVTVHAIVRWDQAGQASFGEPGTIISRGLGGSSAQYHCWHLEIADTGILRWGWEPTTGGGIVAQPGATLSAHSGWYLYTATREYVSHERVLLRYWQNDVLLATHEITTGAPGDIGGGGTCNPLCGHWDCN